MKPILSPAVWIALLLLISLLAPACKRPTPHADPTDAPPAAPSAPALVPEPTASAPSTAARPAFLWKLEGEVPSFLLGTIHVPDPRASALPPAVEQAFRDSQVVLTEIPMDPRTQLDMGQMLLLPSGKTLKTELPADLYQKLEAEFHSKGFPLEPLSSLKLWAVAAHVVLLDHLLVLATRKPLDAQLYERAVAEGKQAAGIETPREQVAAFDSLTRPEQAHMLRKTLEQRAQNRKAGKDPVESLMLAWLSGSDEKMMASVLEEYDPTDPVEARIMKRVLVERNELMANRIAARLKSAPSERHLFAIGAAHLVGLDSVPGRLARQGIKLTRVQ